MSNTFMDEVEKAIRANSKSHGLPMPKWKWTDDFVESSYTLRISYRVFGHNVFAEMTVSDAELYSRSVGGDVVGEMACHCVLACLKQILRNVEAA